MSNYEKYLKYKNKYIKLKNLKIIGGGPFEDAIAASIKTEESRKADVLNKDRKLAQQLQDIELKQQLQEINDAILAYELHQEELKLIRRITVQNTSLPIVEKKNKLTSIREIDKSASVQYKTFLNQLDILLNSTMDDKSIAFKKHIEDYENKHKTALKTITVDKVNEPETNLNIIHSEGDGSCLLHSINTLFAVNDLQIHKSTDEWRTFLIEYILKNIPVILNSGIISKELLNEEILDLLDNINGWLGTTTIIIICTIFNIEINVKCSTKIMSGKYGPIIANANPLFPLLELKGGLLHSGVHWDCYVLK